jgi:hypothetical protein
MRLAHADVSTDSAGSPDRDIAHENIASNAAEHATPARFHGAGLVNIAQPTQLPQGNYCA